MTTEPSFGAAMAWYHWHLACRVKPGFCYGSESRRHPGRHWRWIGCQPER